MLMSPKANSRIPYGNPAAFAIAHKTTQKHAGNAGIPGLAGVNMVGGGSRSPAPAREPCSSPGPRISQGMAEVRDRGSRRAVDFHGPTPAPQEPLRWHNPRRSASPAGR